MISIIPPASVLSHAFMRFAALNVLALNAMFNASPIERLPVANRISPLVCLYEIVAHTLSRSTTFTAASAPTTRDQLRGDPDNRHVPSFPSEVPVQRSPVGLLPLLLGSLLLFAGALAAVLLIASPGDMPWTRTFAAIYALHIIVTTWLPPRPEARQARGICTAAQPLTTVWIAFSVMGHLLVCSLVLSPRYSSHWATFVVGLALVSLFSWLLSMNDSLVTQDQSPVGSGFMDTTTAVIVGLFTHQLPVIMSFFTLWAASDKHEVDTRPVAVYVLVFDMSTLGLLIALAPSWPHSLGQTTAFVTCTWLIGMVAYNMSISH